MSIPRRRGNVKKKLSAAKKVVKKAVKAKPKAKVKTKPKAKVKVQQPRKKAKRPLSVNTKPQRPQKQPLPKKKPAKKKKSTISRTPPPSVSSREELLKRIAVLEEEKAAQARKVKVLEEEAVQARKAQPVETPQSPVEVFLRSPAVAAQITERMIEKNLAEITRNMVRTPESLILGSLIVAEQFGNFDERAKELAVEYDMSLREIYDLWFSPPTKDL